MLSTNDINKITTSDDIAIVKTGLASLLFNDGSLISKSAYSIVDNYINVTSPISNFLSLYLSQGTTNYFEYKKFLKHADNLISGVDSFGSRLYSLKSFQVLVFIDGKKLLPSQYEVVSDTELLIYGSAVVNTLITSVVTIYCSNALSYIGDLDYNSEWDRNTQTLTISAYSKLYFMIFVDGKLLSHDKFSLTNNTSLQINVPLKSESGAYAKVECYLAKPDSTVLLFDEAPGYLSYGPRDKYGFEVPILYDTIVEFSTNIARIAIDDLRPGFFIKETSGNGVLTIVDNDYESKRIKCVELVAFANYSLSSNEYFVQVPTARSILHYVSQFDLSGRLFPEILGIFQRALLDETYDSIQRIKNLRSISKVNNRSVSDFIEFLGMRIDTTEKTISEKRGLLEELTNFYNIVGTKKSYNFYNISASTAKIMDIEQLFTPIKDSNVGGDSIQRYVTFRTAEELGAVTQRRYIYPYQDYGQVDNLANDGESLSNSPNYAGQLQDPLRKAVLNNPTYLPLDISTTPSPTYLERDVPLNTYTMDPVSGPNSPTIDYGWIPLPGEPENSTSFLDYGQVSDTIKGEWIEWFEWERPTNWYPTNHVNVSVEIPPGTTYDEFMREFRKTFYDISSTVLYIHNIIDVYIFGNDKAWEEGQKPIFGLMTSPLYHELDFTFSSDPSIQPPIVDLYPERR